MEETKLMSKTKTLQKFLKITREQAFAAGTQMMKNGNKYYTDYTNKKYPDFHYYYMCIGDYNFSGMEYITYDEEIVWVNNFSGMEIGNLNDHPKATSIFNKARRCGMIENVLHYHGPELIEEDGYKYTCNYEIIDEGLMTVFGREEIFVNGTKRIFVCNFGGGLIRNHNYVEERISDFFDRFS